MTAPRALSRVAEAEPPATARAGYRRVWRRGRPRRALGTHAQAAPVAMLLLTFGTGVLDAATYLGLHGVFTANMTGNVVFIGLGLAGHSGVPLLRSTLALGGFLLGAAVVGRLQRSRPAQRAADPFVASVLGVVAVLMVGMTVVLAVADLSVAGLDAVTALTAGAMGAQAIAARRVGVPDVSTVVVTSTLAGLAADHGAAGATVPRSTTVRRLGAVVAMGSGALTGALLLRWSLPAPVGLSAAILAVVAVRIVLRWRRAAGDSDGAAAASV
jgi:uncharacterized membrane protein YoaK (UPF0700 family)